MLGDFRAQVSAQQRDQRGDREPKRQQRQRIEDERIVGHRLQCASGNCVGEHQFEELHEADGDGEPHQDSGQPAKHAHRFGFTVS